MVNKIIKNTKTIKPWKQTFKYWSNRVNALMFTLPAAWMFLPQEWKEAFMTAVGQKGLFIFSGLAFTGFIARNIQQTKLVEEVKDEANNELDQRGVEG